MVVNLPVGVVIVKPSTRSAAILRRMVETDWWEAMNRERELSFNCVFDGQVPVLYILDFREVAEKWEARFLRECPTAEKVGNTPDNLLFMTGNNYRLTSIDWDGGNR